MTAQEIVFDGLSFGMKIVGDMYERNERFVTDMLKAAKTMDKAMPLLAPLLESAGDSSGPTGTVVIGLVRGNTQDIVWAERRRPRPATLRCIGVPGDPGRRGGKCDEACGGDTGAGERDEGHVPFR